MRDIDISPEKRDRILTWIFILVMRLYGQNIYSDTSYIWKAFELETVQEIDDFFSNVLIDFKTKHQDIAKLLKTQQKLEDILGR